MAEHHEKTLSKKTPVAIELVLVLIAAAVTMGYLKFQVDANAEAVEQVKKRQDVIGEIKTDLAVIKTKIDIIEKRMPYREFSRGRDSKIRPD